MSTILAHPGPATPAGDDPPLWPITVALYTRMVAQGILTERDPVYLWQGRLAPLMPINRPHSLSVVLGYRELGRILPGGFHVESEQPLAFRRQHSVPQPDLMVLRGRVEDYPRDFPTTGDAPLVVEVADSTLARDRKLAGDYASEGLPVYWIVNIPERCIEVFTEPVEGAYNRITPYAEDQEAPVVLDGREFGRLRVRDLLPPAE